MTMLEIAIFLVLVVALDLIASRWGADTRDLGESMKGEPRRGGPL